MTNICNFCLKLSNGCSSVDDTLKETIELDFSITNIPIVCKECLRKLQAYGMFNNSGLNTYNHKQNCFLEKIDTSDLNEAKTFIFETNIDGQHSDIHGVDKMNIKKGIVTIKEFDTEGEQNEGKRDCTVDNQIKDDIEIDEFKYTIEELQIKTESDSCDFQLKNDFLSSNDNFEVKESKQETETLHFEPNMQLDEYVLKEEKISIDDATDADSTPLLCIVNQGIKQQKSNKCSSKHEAVPTETIESNTFSSRFSRKMKGQSSRNSPYQRIELVDGFRCSICPFQNQLEAKVKKHFENYHYNKDSCINLDVIIHEKNFDGRCKCEHCVHKSSNKNNHRKHVKRHSDKRPLYKCEHCDYKTKNKYYLKSHLIVHSRKFYKCEHCDYNTKCQNYLKTHEKRHFNEFSFYECGHCDYKTKYKRYLKLHVMVHSNEHQIYKCVRCDFKTKYKRNLKVHLMVHSNESEIYKCEHCDYNTKVKNNLERHVKRHSDEFPYFKCEHCDYKTKYKKSLKPHLKVHIHESEIYKCMHCDYKNISKKCLKSHLMVHKNYNCALCDYKTKLKQDLRLHLMVHSNEFEIYKCEHCDYITNLKSNFKRHVKRHTLPVCAL